MVVRVVLKMFRQKKVAIVTTKMFMVVLSINCNVELL